ncbi:MAG: hypothetical protein HEP71_16150 [Roseivirga sp.]|nr:hypothetical protein [Roseivirga sp.]
MNSPKVKTQRTLSAVLAAALAIVTLFQAGTANSNEVTAEIISFEEAQLVAEIEQMFMEEEMEMEEEIYFEEMEELTQEVKVYDNNNELIGEGDPLVNPVLGMLVNKADLLSEMGGQKYYRVSQ